MENILHKIQEICNQLEDHKLNQKVIVMHPSSMILVKDKITHHHNIIYDEHESYIFDGKINLYTSFKLPINHFAFMTKLEYKEYFDPRIEYNNG
jgi:hypothetical protein